MDRMNQCHKCRKTIRGHMVYSGGSVWHPECYPNQEALKKSKAKAQKTKAQKRKRK